MHHPTQYQVESNIRQQERLHQAAAHRAAKEAGQGSAAFLRWPLIPFRLVVALVRLVPRPRHMEIGDARGKHGAETSADHI